MAIIKKRKIKELSDKQLRARLTELRLDLAKERAQIAIGGAPTNPGRVRELRRTIAKLLTELKTRR
jgi:large subunit ribosomal protein L29